MPSWPSSTSWPPGTSWPFGTSWPPGTSWPSGDPLGIVTSATMIAWYRADFVALGTGVSTWWDQSGKGRHLTQGTGGAQPTYITSSAAFGNQPALQFDGANDILDNVGGFSWAVISGSFQPFFWGVWRNTNWVANKTIFNTNESANGYMWYEWSTTPGIRQFSNGTLVNESTGAAVGSAVVGESGHTNSTSDFVQMGSIRVSGANAGPGSASSNFHLGGNGSGTNFFAGEFAEFAIWTTIPSANERSALRAYASARYSGVLV